MNPKPMQSFNPCRRLCLVAVLLLGIAAGISVSRANTAYVVPPETPGHSTNYPYASWASAATNIQTAINAAAAEGYSHVLVATGVYRLAGPLSLNQPLTVRSDNAGVSDRANTVINGQALGRCLVMNHAEAIFAGFTITSGKVTGVNTHGGGVQLTAGTLTNCVVTGCSSSRRAGGIYADGASRIADCLVAGNTTGTNGAGIYALDNVIITRSVISNNHFSGVGSGSGVYLAMSSAGTSAMHDCRLVNHSAENALYLYKGAPVISNCMIAANTDRGLYIYGGAGLVVDCVVSGNQVDDYHGAGIFLTPEVTNCHTEIRNCLVVSNTASNGAGGGIYFNQSNSRYAKIVNCTFAANHSTNGGGGYVRGQVINSIFYGNTVVAGIDSNVYSYAGEAVYQNSCVGQATPPAGSGNIADDPQFAVSAAGDYRLAAGSPCINTAASLGWMAGARDLEGRQRLDRYSRLPDMGCYEAVPRGAMYYLH